MNAKIFITDDHYMIVEGIRSLLQHETDMEWTGHAMSAESCLSSLRQQQPDIILMDVNLPDKSGIDLCREVKELYPALHVIGLSSFNQKALIQRMMDNGASGYVLKNATREELREAIFTVMRGNKFLSFEAATIVRKDRLTNVPVMTRREKEVLAFIAEGLTNGEIANKLFVSTGTIDTHRKNLLVKFEVNNTATLIRKAMQLQFI